METSTQNITSSTILVPCETDSVVVGELKLVLLHSDHDSLMIKQDDSLPSCSTTVHDDGSSLTEPLDVWFAHDNHTLTTADKSRGNILLINISRWPNTWVRSSFH